ncbi:ceramide kinase-like [Mizuhopecten yessoensis]|uniref:Ceramide kinase n=1 Tax=Mizuhopecten yessoensis TaxID=6573 RepID=A0A210R0J7_MIZYE|nr:ceramide kinase-like [Mizuhopecten yessoensis]OWF54540.1 Ceramide kinase [Mizuhopecten yessoensis]
MTSYRLKIDVDTDLDVIVDENHFTFTHVNEKVCVEFPDLVAVSDQTSENNDQEQSVTLHYIKQSAFSLSKEVIKVCGEASIVKQFLEHVRAKFKKVPTSKPRHFLVFINPIGGKGTGVKTFEDTVKPLFDLASITYQVVVSERANVCTEVMESQDLTHVDGIVVCGGDGTLSEVTNVLLRRTMVAADLDFNDPKVKVPTTAIPIGHIPTGTANVMSYCCNGCVDIVTATLSIIKGNTRPIGASGVYSGGKLIRYSLVGVSSGFIADMMDRRDQLRWMGMFRLLWVPIQMLFSGFRNFTTEITLDTRKKKPMTEGDKEEITYTKREEKFEGDIFNTMVLCWNIKDVHGKPQIWPNRGPFQTFILYKKACTRYQFLWHVVKLFKAKKEALQGDYLECYQAAGYIMKVKEDSPLKENLGINIDGDPFKLPEPYHENRFYHDAVRMFTSLTDTDADSSIP